MSKKTTKVARFGRRTAVAISALLKCHTVEEAAQVTHIPASTLRRWRTRPEFASQLCTAQSEIIQGTVNALRDAGAGAATTLGEIARDPFVKAPSRVRACVAIISLLLRSHETETIEARLCKLEHDAKLRDNHARR
jgi:hypothetical protein